MTQEVDATCFHLLSEHRAALAAHQVDSALADVRDRKVVIRVDRDSEGGLADRERERERVGDDIVVDAVGGRRGCAPAHDGHEAGG
ncbi:hypothetical protein D3C86_1994310 [compost metagenome]